jgi:uncharacterized membrane protein YfcA
MSLASIIGQVSPKSALLFTLGVIAAAFVTFWWSAIRRRTGTEPIAPTPAGYGIGFLTDFLDTLGIGSFATTTTLFEWQRTVRDEVLPGTLNVGHALPTIVQAFIYIAIVEVEMPTLVLLISASVLGMWLGAGVVSRWPRRNIQIGMGIALLVAAALTLMSLFNAQTGGGEALGLHGARLWIGVFGNFALGALMSLGIGLYGPCLIMISLLGMDPRAAFPIMMGSCAFLMPIGSTQFIRKGSYDVRAALGLALGGIPAVLIAAFIVKSLNLYYVRWLVVIVVVYTAVQLLRTAARERRAQQAA